jgi:hypothetical protein
VEPVDNFGIGIGQQRKINVVAFREILQDRRTIVTNRRQFQPLRFKFLFCILQLYELRFAEGSPVRGAEE